MEFDEMTWEEVEYISDKIASHGIDCEDERAKSDRIHIISIDGDGFIEIVRAPKRTVREFCLMGNQWICVNGDAFVDNFPNMDYRKPSIYLMENVPKDMHDHLVGIINMEMM